MQQRIKQSFKICYCHCPTLFHFFSLEVSIFTPFANYVCHVPEFFLCVCVWLAPKSCTTEGNSVFFSASRPSKAYLMI